MYTGPSLVPSPTPSFSSLAVRYCKRRKAGRGTGNEATQDQYMYKHDCNLRCVGVSGEKGATLSFVCNLIMVVL